MNENKTEIKHQNATDLAEERSSYFARLSDIKNGKWKAYETLADIYQKGLCGIEADINKAIEMRKRYVKEFRRHVPVDFNVVTYTIDTGNMYLEQGNKYRAAECFLDAILLLQEQHRDDPEELKRLEKKYQLEELMKKTGCENIV